MGFLGFAVTCFDVLAWPLISLGYPLCASIRAIEVKSNLEMQKLITYWILFSLISLLELGFSKFIEWLPFWPYIKLMTISALVLPRFDGAYHVYVCFVRPYCHVNPQVLINKFNKLKESSYEGENFLATVEKYVEENGCEALEKLIASKSKGTTPSYDVEEIKAVEKTQEKEVVAAIQSKGTKPSYDVKEIQAVANMEKKEVVTAIESKCEDPIVVQKDIKAVEQTEKNAAAANKSKGKDPIVVQKDIKAVEQTEKNAAAVDKHIWPMKNNTGNIQDFSWKPKTESKGKDPIVVQKDVKAVEQTEKNAGDALKSRCNDPIFVRKDIKAVEQTGKNAAAAAKNGEQNLGHAEKKINATVEIKETTTTTSVAAGGGENKFPEATTPKKIQKEWTCALCQLTCTSEKNLESHLLGKKHRDKWEELKASKQTNKYKGSSSTTPNKYDQANQENSYKQRNPKNAGTHMQQSKFWCGICHVRCSGEIDMASHLKGRKHLESCKIRYGQPP